MPAPSFSIRAPGRRALAVAAAVALLLGGGLAALLLKSDGGIARKPELPTPQLAFVTKVEPVSGAKSAAPQPAVTAEAQALTALFTGWYQRAFVDPKMWNDPTFAAVAQNFTAEARGSFARDVASLTIGPEAITELRRVEPSQATLTLTIYFDAAGAARYAVASVRFAAVGTLKGKGPPLDIAQTGTYYLSKIEGFWRVFSYTAHQDQAQPTPSPSAAPSP
jgi:hypothetical protein